MNAIPPDFPRPGRHARAELLPDADLRLAARWSALAGAARVVAALAQVPNVEPALAAPFALERATGGRRVLVEQGLEDMLAMMEPGVTALLDVTQRGGQSAPAAMALWQEFLRARQGLAALAPLGPTMD
jgi:hypothetical protein